MNKYTIVILTLLCAVFVVHALHYEHVQDDAFISYRYVENFLEGHGLVFNYDEKIEGYTNFLWIMILALIVKIGLPIILSSQILGIICGVAVILMSALITQSFCDPKKWYLILIPPFLLSINGALAYWTIGGMETALFVLLVILTLHTEIKRPSLTPLVIVLATLCRPDGGLLFGIIFIYRLFIIKSGWKPLLTYALLYIGLLIPYALFKLIYFGDLLPNPFYAKTGTSLEYIISGGQYLALFLYHYAIFGVLFVLPFFFYRNLSTKIKLPILTVIIFTLYIILVGGDVLKVQRFFLPLLPFLYLFISYAISQLKKPQLGIAAVILLAVWTVYIPWKYIHETQQREHGLIDAMTDIIDLVVSVDRTDFTVATTTIGKVSYQLKGHKVIDMLGLTDRHIAKHPEKIEGLTSSWKERNFNCAYLLQQKPDYIIFSTGYKPSAPAERALFLNSQFRQNYSTMPFLLAEKGGLTAVWKKNGDFTQPNRILSKPEYAELFHKFFSNFDKGNYIEGEQLIREILTLGENDFSLPNQLLGTIYFINNDFDSAFKYYDRALQIDPSNIECRLNIFAYYRNYGDTLNQRIVLEQIDQLAPWLSSSLRLLSRN